MSYIQDAAKPVLLPLILGNWNTLSLNDQRIIATWAIMTTIVLESAHPETATVPRDERHNFREHKTPPIGWSVWIGKNADRQSGVFDHLAWELAVLGTENVRKGYNSQTTGFVLGNLFILTLRATWNTGTARAELAYSIAREFGVSVVWPTNRHWAEPTALLDYAGWSKVSRAVGKIFNVPYRNPFLPQT